MRQDILDYPDVYQYERAAPFSKLNFVIDALKNAIDQTGFNRVNNPVPREITVLAKVWKAGILA